MSTQGITLDDRDRCRLQSAMDGYTQTDVAKAAGISQPMLSMVLSGVSGVSIETLEAIAAALGMSVDVKTRVMFFENNS